MLKYLQKFTMDILPSVAATIIGAYIVNHYIVAKPADAPTAAVSSATPKSADPKNVPTVVAAKPADASIDAPQPGGVTAKGISEQALIEKAAAERPAEVKPTETKSPDVKSPDVKSVEVRPAETASLPADPRRRPPPPHEKAIAKLNPAQSTAPVAPAAETAAAPSDEHRDANELAREAIERLRANGDAASRAPEAPRVQEVPREAPRMPPSAVASVPPPLVRPLPPPVILATPPADKPDLAGNPPYTASVPVDDPNRPIPPADIPPARPRPLADLRAQAANAASHATDVAQDMLSAAKSMFHAVLPGSGQNGGRQFSDEGHFRSD
jgi:hypothetical protein